MFENQKKKSSFELSYLWYFQSIFVVIDLSGTTVWPPASIIKKIPTIFGICYIPRSYFA